MIVIDKILEKNEKKIYINDYISDEIREKDENGNYKNDDFITIKKLDYKIKKKIEFLSLSSMSGQTGKAIFQNLKKRGIDIGEMEKLTQMEQAEIMLDMKFTESDSNSITKMTNDIAKCIIDYGVDKHKHSFVDSNNKPIELSYEVFESIGSSLLVDFIIKEIKSFSQGFILGE